MVMFLMASKTWLLAPVLGGVPRPEMNDRRPPVWVVIPSVAVAVSLLSPLFLCFGAIMRD